MEMVVAGESDDGLVGLVVGEADGAARKGKGSVGGGR
jgi:hypothetical protein